MTHEITVIDKKSIAMTCVNFSLLNCAVKFALKTVLLTWFLHSLIIVVFQTIPATAEN